MEDEWIYPSDRLPIIVKHWGPGEPQGHDRENCVTCFNSTHGLWADVPCSFVLSYVCESPM